VKYSSLIGDPLVVFPEESYPIIFVFYFDKFNSSMCFLWEIDVVSGVMQNGACVLSLGMFPR